MNGGTHFVFGLIDEVPDGVNEVVAVIGLRRWANLPVGEFGRVGVEIFLSDEVEFVLFNQFVGDDVSQESAPVRVNVGKDGILLVFSGLDPVFTVQTLQSGPYCFVVAHSLLYRLPMPFRLILIM